MNHCKLIKIQFWIQRQLRSAWLWRHALRYCNRSALFPLALTTLASLQVRLKEQEEDWKYVFPDSNEVWKWMKERHSGNCSFKVPVQEHCSCLTYLLTCLVVKFTFFVTMRNVKRACEGVRITCPITPFSFTLDQSHTVTSWVAGARCLAAFFKAPKKILFGQSSQEASFTTRHTLNFSGPATIFTGRFSNPLCICVDEDECYYYQEEQNLKLIKNNFIFVLYSLTNVFQHKHLKCFIYENA